MRAPLLLRIAAVLSFLYFLGHSAGMPWTPSEGGETAAVVGGMKSFRFDVAGSVRSYWDFYQGFGLTVSVFMLLESSVLWLLAGLARQEPARVRPFVVAFLIANLAQLALVVRFFFLPPRVLSVANTLCLGLATWAAGRRAAPART
ncbi:MAG TPA: hypothetical protein VFD38_19025, partial [Myxococcaceae bacterium]|nr:hypothetical protein [Myxococcaceae bacterium]